MLSANNQPEFVNEENMDAARARVAAADAYRLSCSETIAKRVHRK